MRKIAPLLMMLLFTAITTGQFKQNRKNISGKITVNKTYPAAHINVFNLTSGEYTFTDKEGSFEIAVQKNDELVFSSIQYQQFSVIITKSVLKKEELRINLREGVTQLDEIVIKPKLTGDLTVDVKKLDFQKANYPNIDIEKLLHGYQTNFIPDRWSAAGQTTIDKKYLQNGLKFVNIFKALFHANQHATKVTKGDDIDLRQIYNDEFFKKNLDIEKEEIPDFISYLKNNGLNKIKLHGGNDLQLIQFLVEKSKLYKAEGNKE